MITVEGQSPEIQIKKVTWEVRAGYGGSHVAQIVPGPSKTKLCRNFDKHQLAALLGDASATSSSLSYPIICMLEDDKANYAACKTARDWYGFQCCIVPQNEPEWTEKFNELGATVIDPNTIVIEPLQQFLGSAQSAALLLHNDSKCQFLQAVVDQACAGLTIQQCRLPKDVQVHTFMIEVVMVEHHSMRHLRH